MLELFLDWQLLAPQELQVVDLQIVKLRMSGDRQIAIDLQNPLDRIELAVYIQARLDDRAWDWEIRCDSDKYLVRISIATTEPSRYHKSISPEPIDDPGGFLTLFEGYVRALKYNRGLELSSELR